MQIPTPSFETIAEFLAQKHIAMIGISRNPKDFSASLFRELERRGYDIVPVNPKASEVMGRPALPEYRTFRHRSMAREKAVTFCQECGMQVVPGQCPFMFLPGSGRVHTFHGFLRKIFGKYPRHQHAV